MKPILEREKFSFGVCMYVCVCMCVAYVASVHSAHGTHNGPYTKGIFFLSSASLRPLFCQHLSPLPSEMLCSVSGFWDTVSLRCYIVGH